MKTIKRLFTQVRLIFLVTTILVLGGCVKQHSMENQQDQGNGSVQGQVIQHTIKYQGETYALIARWYTGNSQNWKAIADANPAIKPTRMRLGEVIVIPRSLVKEERPLPKEFVARSTTSSVIEPAPVVGVEGQETIGVSETMVGPSQVPVENQDQPGKPLEDTPIQQNTPKSPLLEGEGVGEINIPQQAAPTAKPVETIGPSQTISQPNSEEEINKAKLLNELLD